MLITETGKWTRTVAINLSKESAYKLNFLLVLVAPTVVLLFIQYSVWSAIYSYNDLAQLGEYSLKEMLRYQSLVMLVMLVAQSQRSWNLSEDIRYGRLTAYLLYPFEFWKFQSAAFLAHECIQLVVAVISFTLLTAAGVIYEVIPLNILHGLFFCLGVSVLWFAIQYACGIMAFWLEETWIFRATFEMTATFLSGAVMPLSLFPAWLQEALAWTPFPLMTYVPVQLLCGTYQGSIAQAWLLLAFWIGVSILGSAYLWRRGLKYYTAAGI